MGHALHLRWLWFSRTDPTKPWASMPVTTTQRPNHSSGRRSLSPWERQIHPLLDRALAKWIGHRRASSGSTGASLQEPNGVVSSVWQCLVARHHRPANPAGYYSVRPDQSSHRRGHTDRSGGFCGLEMEQLRGILFEVNVLYDVHWPDRVVDRQRALEDVDTARVQFIHLACAPR
jgi:hypothetical protein